MVKVKRDQEARVNFNPNFSFKMFRIMRFLRSPKCLKSIVELTFPIQKANPFTLLYWLFCSAVHILGKFGQKTENCQFKLKYISCLGKFGPKNQNCQFKLKFGNKTNSNMQNSMMMFTFSVFNHNYPSWVNLVQKFKIVCSK